MGGHGNPRQWRAQWSCSPAAPSEGFLGLVRWDSVASAAEGRSNSWEYTALHALGMGASGRLRAGGWRASAQHTCWQEEVAQYSCLAENGVTERVQRVAGADSRACH